MWFLQKGRAYLKAQIMPSTRVLGLMYNSDRLVCMYPMTSMHSQCSDSYFQIASNCVFCAYSNCFMHIPQYLDYLRTIVIVGFGERTCNSPVSASR